jgi:hypothetical protein
LKAKGIGESVTSHIPRLALLAEDIMEQALHRQTV